MANCRKRRVAVVVVVIGANRAKGGTVSNFSEDDVDAIDTHVWDECVVYEDAKGAHFRILVLVVGVLAAYRNVSVVSTGAFFVFRDRYVLLLGGFYVYLEDVAVNVKDLSCLLVFLFGRFGLAIYVVREAISVRRRLLQGSFRDGASVGQDLAIHYEADRFVFPVVEVAVLVAPSNDEASVLVPQVPDKGRARNAVRRLVLSHFSIPETFRIMDPWVKRLKP